MFHLEYALLVYTFFLSLVSPVAVGNAGVSVGWCVGVEHSDIQTVLSKRPPQNPFTAISSLAPSAVLEVALVMASPVSGCRSGCVMRSGTSVSIGLPLRPVSYCDGVWGSHLLDRRGHAPL